MTISRKSIIYKIYFILICLSYMMSVNILPPLIQWVGNKLWIASLISLTALLLIQNEFRIQKRLIYPISILLLFSFILNYIYIFHFDSDDGFAVSFSSGFLYFLLFLSFTMLSKLLTIQNILKPFLVSTIVILLLSVAVYLGYKPRFYLDNQESLDMYLDLKFGSKLVGFSGLYLNQNIFGMTLLTAESVIFSAIILNRNLKNSFYYKFLILCFLITLFFIFLTVSRATILATLIILLLFNIRNYKNKLSLYLTLLGLTLCLFVYLYFNTYINFLIDRVSNDGTSSRTDIWANALNVFKQNFWFGVGEYKYYTSSGGRLSAHNAYIHKLASQGIIASLLWFSWLLYGLYCALKQYFNKDTVIHVVLATSYIAILVHQFFENAISNTYVPITVFLMMTYSLLLNTSKTS